MTSQALSSRQALLLAMRLSKEESKDGTRPSLTKSNEESKHALDSSNLEVDVVVKTKKRQRKNSDAFPDGSKAVSVAIGKGEPELNKIPQLDYRPGMRNGQIWKYLKLSLEDTSRRRSFKLTKELQEYRDLQLQVRETRSTGLRTPETAMDEYIQIQRSILSSKRRKQAIAEWEDEKVACICKPDFHDKHGVAHGCGEASGCINRGMQIECTDDTCPILKAKGFCENQQLQVASTLKSRLVLRDAKERGLGLFATEDIPQGSFIAEYVGEVISTQECERRMANEYLNEKHKYLMTLSQGEIVDATRKGGLARFINHSCNPIAGVQMWKVRGEPRIVIFASHAIKKDQEITIDYNFQRLDNKIEKCHCGASNCRGVLGAQRDSKKLATQKIMQRKRIVKGTDPVSLKNVGLNLTPTDVPKIETARRKVIAGTAPSFAKDLITARDHEIFLPRNIVRGVRWLQ